MVYMSLFIGKQPIRTVILDFDQTLYPDNDPNLEKAMWDEIKNSLINELLILQKIQKWQAQEFDLLMRQYRDLGPKIGWTSAYYSLGGEPATFTRVARNHPKAKFLKPDKRLKQIMAKWRGHVRVIIFSGSSRHSVEESVNVLLSGQYQDFVETIVADDDLPVGVEKPNRDAYEVLLKSQGIDAMTAVMVDDQPAEIETALALGMQAVLVGTRHSAEIRARFPYHISTIHELETVLIS